MTGRTEISWVVTGPDPHLGHCLRCGGTIAMPPLPIELSQFSHYLRHSSEVHRYCEDKQVAP